MAAATEAAAVATAAEGIVAAVTGAGVDTAATIRVGVTMAVTDLTTVTIPTSTSAATATTATRTTGMGTDQTTAITITDIIIRTTDMTTRAAAPAVYAAPAQGRYLGIDEQSVVDAGVQGMQVLRVYAGSAAEQAGLQAGDVIYSANGYLTQQHGNLAWIIATVPPNGVLQMNVRIGARDGSVHAVNAQLP